MRLQEAAIDKLHIGLDSTRRLSFGLGPERKNKYCGKEEADDAKSNRELVERVTGEKCRNSQHSCDFTSEQRGSRVEEREKDDRDRKCPTMEGLYEKEKRSEASFRLRFVTMLAYMNIKDPADAQGHHPAVL